MRPLYKRRRDTLIAALAERLPDLEPTGIAAGLHLLAYLPSDLDERSVVDAAARRGVAAYGLAPYRLADSGRAALLFGYATLSERTIVEGIETLAEVIADVRAQAAIDSPTPRGGTPANLRGC
jgi:GntR family transcriptional regulator/MocR family aminotransferase